MEIDQTKINKRNAGKCHGLWGDKNWKTHYYKGSLMGYYYSHRETSWQVHCMNDKFIGCFKFGKLQCYLKTSSKKFGEHIIWK